MSLGRGQLAVVIATATVLGMCQPSAAADGGLDRSFSGDGRADVGFPKQTLALGALGQVAVGPDGRAVLATTTVRRRSPRNGDIALARFTRRGRLDRSFGRRGRRVVHLRGDQLVVGVAIQDRRIVVAADGIHHGTVVRLTAKGKLDGSFAGDGAARVDLGRGSVTSMVLQPNGRALLAGNSYDDAAPDQQPNYDFAVGRLTRSGDLDRSFSEDGVTTIDLRSPSEAGADSVDTALAVTTAADGRIVLAGISRAFSEYTARAGVGVVSLLADGGLDQRFGDDGVALAGPQAGTDYNERTGAFGGAAVAVRDDGRVVFGGATHGDFVVSQLTRSGVPDLSFAAAGTATIDGGDSHDLADALAIDSSGSLLLAGSARRESSDYAVVRLQSDGRADPLFGRAGIRTADFRGDFDDADGVEILPNGKILAAGTVGNGRVGLLRLRDE